MNEPRNPRAMPLARGSSTWFRRPELAIEIPDAEVRADALCLCDAPRAPAPRARLVSAVRGAHCRWFSVGLPGCRAP